MRNPGFEQVSGTGSLDSFFGPLLPHWTLWDTAAASDVPYWTATDVYQGTYQRVAVLNGSSVFQAFQGSRYARVPGSGGAHPQELIGKLSGPMQPGRIYLVGVRSQRSAWAGGIHPFPPLGLELRLRNSATGAQSPPIVAGPDGPGWRLQSGTVTGNAGYDRVVLRYNPAASTQYWLGVLDDVRVCKAALHDRPPGWWTTSHVVGAAVLGSVLIAGLVWGRRRFSTRRQPISGTTSGWNVPQ